MKIAILGSGPQSVELGSLFDQLGAQICFFTDGQDDLKKFAQVYGTIVKENFYASYLPEREELWHRHQKREERVKRIYKRFLLPHEWSGERRRLKDLFRIIFESVSPEKLKIQMEENPDLYKKLPKEMLDNLQHSLESFDDFDLVVDARERWSPHRMGPGTWALSEQTHAESESIGYGARAVLQSAQFISSQEIALIGSGELALLCLINAESWLFSSPHHRLFLATTEERPFEQLINESPDWAAAWENIKTKVEQKYKEDAEQYWHQMNYWKGLEDYEKAKVPRPESPIPKLVVFSGHNVASVDALIDHKKIFLTLEIPDFRLAGMQPENAQLSLKTIGVDNVWVTTGTHWDGRIFSSMPGVLKGREPGVFVFNNRSEILQEAGRKQFEEKKKEMLSFVQQLFTRI